ncbi:uncharacterized protein DSM5745_03268 [Aspergillus mulundensis]|uniref:Mid2 domain-containing protein n=1 Tax=Aspergillus mulundensis TaxID=1810919 RepID=A0A3D8SK20_9EURO|nr:hypothetical protein DSM5745_03268 [Aspergillus mulundensis]RDW86626.1 hypothetical protein DSM5745_03268 [Aspergillus mulundensis]
MIRSSSTFKSLIVIASIIATALAETQCTWPDGSEAKGYAPCDPNAEKSACCLVGEICLTSGLCYGKVGLNYRGACMGEWDDVNICPDACNSLNGSSSSFVNIWPCDGQGNTAPMKYWCGNGESTPCETTTTKGADNGLFLDIGGKGTRDSFNPQRILSADSSSALSTANSSTSTSTSTTAVKPTESAANTNATADANLDTEEDSASTDTGKIVAVGAGVGVPLLVVSLVLAAWALWERRARKKLLQKIAAGMGGNASYPARQSAAKQLPDQEIFEIGSGRWRPPVAEMQGSGPVARRADNASLI